MQQKVISNNIFNLVLLSDEKPNFNLNLYLFQKKEHVNAVQVFGRKVSFKKITILCLWVIVHVDKTIFEMFFQLNYGCLDIYSVHNHFHSLLSYVEGVPL